MQVGGRHPAALDLLVRGLDLVGLEPDPRRDRGRLEPLGLAPDQQVHAVVRVAEVELLLRLGHAERLGGRRARRDRLRQPELAREQVDLALVEARDRLHVREPVPALDEEPLVVLEQVRGPDHGIAQPVGPRVLDQLPHPLLDVGGGDQLPVRLGGHPFALLRSVRALHDERENDHPARRRRANQLVLPRRLVIGEHAADRLVAPPVAAQGLERVGDRLLLGPRAERVRQLEAEVGGRAADVPLREPQAEHVLRPMGPDADACDHTRIHASRHRDHGATPTQLAHGRGGLGGQPRKAGGGVERNPGGRLGDSRSRASLGHALAAQHACDHHLLYLVRALPDRQDLRVAVEAADRILLDVPVAAVDLHRLLGGPDRKPTADQLRLGGGERVPLAPILLHRGPVGEQPRGLDLRGDVRDLALDRLVLGDRLAPGLPLLRVRDRLVQGALGEADPEGGDPDAPALQRVHELPEATPSLAKQVGLGHPAVREAQRAGVGGVPAHLAVGLADLVAGRPVGDDDVRDLAAVVGLVGQRGDRHATGDVGPCVGDELLRAVDHELAVGEPRGRAGVPRVGAGLRLREPERGQLPPAAQVRQPLRLLLIRAPEVNRHRAEGAVGGDRDRQRGVDGGQLLDRYRVGKGVGPAAPVLLRKRDPHQAQLTQLRHQLIGKALRAVQLRGDRRHLVAREVADRFAQQPLLVVKLEVQGGESLRAA